MNKFMNIEKIILNYLNNLYHVIQILYDLFIFSIFLLYKFKNLSVDEGP